MLFLFCSVAVLDPRVGHTTDVLSPFISVQYSNVILIDSSTECPVHDLMLSIQAVRGLPRLRAHGMFLALSLSPGYFLVSSSFPLALYLPIK